MIRALFVFLLFISTSASAQELVIQITQGRDNPTSIAVVPFAWNGSGLAPEDAASIVEADLLRSGQFEDMDGAAERILFDDDDTPDPRDGPS